MAIDMDVDDVDEVEEASQNESDEDREDTQFDENSDNAEDDDQEDDEDDDDDGDDDDDEDDDEDEEEDDEDDDDDDDAEGDTTSHKQRSPTPAVNSSPAAYVRAAENRLNRLRASSSNLAKQAPAYSIEPVGAIPHSAHIHSMALSADGTNLLTGGSDGYVRRYDVYASMNGKAPLTQNIRHQYVDGVIKGGALTAWWACEEVPLVKGEDEEEAEERLVSPVHSLAIQQDALWCLSGTESGNINLNSLRHDSGQLRHVLRRHTSAVSALALTDADTVLMSGGWDRGLHQWDMHTGKVVRSFPGHTGQITSISFRPLQQGETYSNAPSPNVIIRPSAAESTNNGDTSMQENNLATEEASSHKIPLSPKKSQSERSQSKDTLQTGDVSMKVEKQSDSNEGKAQENGSSPSRKSPENSSLFGEDGEKSNEIDGENGLHEALGLGTISSDAPTKHNLMDVTMDEADLKPTQPTKNEKTADDSDGDSLFGDMSADGSADADGEADADAEGEEDAEGEADDMDAEGEDDDAEGEDDDAPLAARAARPLLPTSSSSAGLELPGSKPATQAIQSATASSSSLPNGHTTPANTKQRQLPKPAFGGASTFASFDGDVSKFSNDIMMTTTLGGQVTLWDKRVPSYPGSSSSSQANQTNGISSSSTHKGVRALALPDKTPPWCTSACWSSDGNKIYVGRRNETVDEWDLRMLPDVEQSLDESQPARLRKGDIRFLRSLRLPSGSGPVSAVYSMPNSRHLICGSYDNIRIWDTMADSNNASGSGSVPFRIVAGHHGATVSQLLVDPTSRFLFSSSGDRGWMSTSTETVMLHEIRPATW